MEMEASGRLKILRILNGYSQDALSALIDVSPTAMNLWEGGKRGGPSKKAAPRLAAALGVTLGFITEGPGGALLGEPPVGPAFWVPSVPPRGQHANAMIRDIGELLPQFLRENGFTCAVVAGLADGGQAYLIGRGGRHDCLALVDQRLAEAFATAITVAELDVQTITNPLTATVQSFTVADLSTFTGVGVDVDAEGIGTRMARRQGMVPGRAGEVQFATTTPDSSVSAPKNVTEALFRMFAGVVRGRDDEAVRVMARFFAEKLEALDDAGISVEEIDYNGIAAEAEKLLAELKKGKLSDLYPEWC